ncbi:hypothetical protein RGQ29_014374 [Quercus rubra]|uniref:Glycine-rich protein n=1 Tax=Quercus rubra TaxID=3512 RepID=A0AAN7FVB6_QUERU|nr:hypothetical protein RGQ29_014372 [Quercus rubra]KAK4596311.1 hypothetical protein RGQ29_014374 [Quercus rubra]
MAFSSSFKLLAMAFVLAIMLLMSSEIVEATQNFKLGRRALVGVGVPYYGGYAPLVGTTPPGGSGGYYSPP